MNSSEFLNENHKSTALKGDCWMQAGRLESNGDFR